LGLIDAEGRVKPIGRAFAEVAAELRARPVPPSVRQEAVVVDVDERDVPLSRADCAPGGAVFTAWTTWRSRTGDPPWSPLASPRPRPRWPPAVSSACTVSSPASPEDTPPSPIPTPWE